MNINIVKDFIYSGQEIDTNIEDNTVYLNDEGIIIKQNGVALAYGIFDPNVPLTSKASIGPNVNVNAFTTAGTNVNLGCFFVPEFTVRSGTIAGDSLIGIELTISTFNVDYSDMKTLLTASTSMDGSTNNIDIIYGNDPLFTTSNTYVTTIYLRGNDLLISDRWYLINGPMVYYFDITKFKLELSKDSDYKLFYTYVNVTQYNGTNYKEGYELVNNTITQDLDSLTKINLTPDENGSIDDKSISHSTPFAVRDLMVMLTNDGVTYYPTTTRNLIVFVGDSFS